jgi:hypothetical protein
MTPPTSPVDKTLMVGSVSASEQEITLPGVVTHTRSKAVRAPCWVLVVTVVLLDPSEALRMALSAVVG